MSGTLTGGQTRLRLQLEDFEALRRSEARYQSIMERAPIGIVLGDREGLITLANRAFQHMLRWSARELIGRHFTDVTHPDDIASNLEVVRRAVAGHRAGQVVDKRYRRKDGSFVWARVSISAVTDPDGTVQGVLAMQEDISALREIKEALRKSEARSAELFERNPAVQLLIDPATGAIVDANPAACAFYGASRHELQATTIHRINTLSAEIVAAEMARAQREERQYFVFQHRLWSGEERDVEVHSSPVEINSRPLVYSIVHDITERKRVEAELIHQSLHDLLTGLPNRVLLHDRLEQAILRAQRDGGSLALLVLDIDHFKEINDTSGHDMGDQVLQQMALRFQEVLRESNSLVRLVPATVARLGGDEFAAIVNHVDERGARKVADQLLAAVREPLALGGEHLSVSASMGIALYPRHGRDAGGLLQRADVAMYLAKRRHDGYTVYDASQDQYSPERHAIFGELRGALETNGLHLHYQPQVICLTGKTVRVEALARWQHPQRGNIPPTDFIPMAERTGLIAPLTMWVLRRALEECVDWRRQGREVGVAVNLSPQSLSDRELTQNLERIVHDAEADFRWLDVEITESAIMEDVEQSMCVLQDLHQLGVRISIDDFGTGYSSLTYLRRLPVDAVKIDRSFVVEMAVNPEDGIIVRSVIDLAHNLGLEVVAEGVEDSAAYNMLVAMGCEVAQGYFLSRPLAAEGIAAWLATDHVHTIS